MWVDDLEPSSKVQLSSEYTVEEVRESLKIFQKNSINY